MEMPFLPFIETKQNSFCIMLDPLHHYSMSGLYIILIMWFIPDFLLTFFFILNIFHGIPQNKIKYIL